MKFTASSDVSQVKPEELPKYLDLALQNIAALLNNGLGFAENFDAKSLSIAFSAINTDTASMHGLGRVPSGYIQIGQNAAMKVYDGASANTAQLLYLKSDAVGTARILVY